MSDTAILLRSDRLTVEISTPGTAYAGTRFDWTGFITQVTLDDCHTFCVPEDYRPGQGTGGIGLCNEFGIDLPIGYDSARPGECFPKLGIGLLTRLDKPDYSFWYPHQIAQQFPIDFSFEDDSAKFTVHPVNCRGYAARLVKKLVVIGTTLSIHYDLQNTGDLPIQTNEYIHNFVGIDHKEFGPDYHLNFPFIPIIESPSDMNAILQSEGSRMSQKATPTNQFYARLTGFCATDQPQWELVHQPSRTAMRETVDFTPTRVAIWGSTHVISVEVFAEIALQPGESKQWSRNYEFLYKE